jgi:transcriptional antiterminator NusG
MNHITHKTPEPEWGLGQTVHIIAGPFVDFTGEIYEIRAEEKKLRVKVDLFGRKTPVELDFSQIEAIDEAD